MDSKGRNEVRVKPETAAPVALSSTSETVESALQMRHDKVRTLAVHTSKGTRIVSLKRASESAFKFDAKSATDHIFKRWAHVLEALAK